MHKENAWLFQRCRIAIQNFGFKATLISILIGSVPVRQTVHIERATRHHRKGAKDVS
jgi:hypothetical protein